MDEYDILRGTSDENLFLLFEGLLSRWKFIFIKKEDREEAYKYLPTDKQLMELTKYYKKGCAKKNG